MNTQAKIQPDAFEQLKSTLEDAPRNYDFLAEYVRELELRRQEQDVVHDWRASGKRERSAMV